MAEVRPKGKKTLTKKQIEQIENCAPFLTAGQIADLLGVSRATFYEIMKRDPEVARRYKRGKAKALNDVASNLVQQALGGNITAAIFYLKTRGGWRETDDMAEDDGAPSSTRIELVVVDADADHKAAG